MTWGNLRKGHIEEILEAVGQSPVGSKAVLLERLSCQSIQEHVDRMAAVQVRGALAAVGVLAATATLAQNALRDEQEEEKEEGMETAETEKLTVAT